MKRRAMLAAALLAGCSNPLSRPYPEKRLYVLEANTRARRIYEEAGYRNYERFLSKRL